MNSISALITERLTEFISKMVTIININRDKSVSLGDREYYSEGFDTTNLQKTGKHKAVDPHAKDSPAMMKIVQNMWCVARFGTIYAILKT